MSTKRSRRIKHHLRAYFLKLRLVFPGHHKDDRLMIDCLQGKSWSEQDLNSLKLIEGLRDQLKKSDQEIKLQDFGAGVDNVHSNDQMESGVWLTKKVCELPVSNHKMGEAMYQILRAFKPTSCIELGTSSGISAAYGVMALKLNSNNGKYNTLEGADEVAKVAQNTIQQCDYSNFEITVGRFSDTIDKVLQESEPVDFAFIDGHHVEDATIEYFEKVLNKSKEKSVLIFDDINWSQGMYNAWMKIRSHEKVISSFDVFDRGIVIIDSSRKNGRHYTVKV